MCAFERSEKGTDFIMMENINEENINVKEKMNNIKFSKNAETLAAVHTHTHTRCIVI